MTGFLLLWGYPLIGTAPLMGWMTDETAGGHHGAAAPETDHTGMGAAGSPTADGALMPGMATDTQIVALTAARGDDSAVLFLQLMIRHHQGGIPMMNDAATNATDPWCAPWPAQWPLPRTTRSSPSPTRSPATPDPTSE